MPDDSRSLAPYQPYATFFNAEKFALAQRVATLFSQSNLVPEHLRGPQRIADCLIALDMAEQMHENPIMVMQNIYFVHGRAGWSAQYMVARANRSGIFSGPLRWKSSGQGESLSVTCYADLARCDPEGDPHVEITVDMAMAKADGWTKNDKYRSMPEHMLRWRSATWLIRTHCPEVMMGLPAADELEDIHAAGRWVDVTPATAPPRPVLDHFEQRTSSQDNSNPAAVVDGQAGDPPATATVPPPSPGKPRRSRATTATTKASEEHTPAEPPPAPPEGDEPEEEHPAGDEPETPPSPPPETPSQPAATGSAIHVGPYDVFVPGGDAPQLWYKPAKQKLDDMTAANCPPEDFRRFREVHAETLGKMQEGFSWWFDQLAAQLRQGENRTQ